MFSAVKTKSIYSIAYLELLKIKKKKKANNFFCLHEALAVYFSPSLQTAEKELSYPLTFMTEKIAKVVTYPAEVCKKKKLAPSFFPCCCAFRNHPALMTWSAAPQTLY